MANTPSPKQRTTIPGISTGTSTKACFHSAAQSEFAPSDYDVRHNFKLYGVWTPRFFHGEHSWLEKIAGGWTVTGIFNAHTGFPWTPFLQCPSPRRYQFLQPGVRK